MTAGSPISSRAASVLSGQLTLIERGAGMPSSAATSSVRALEEAMATASGAPTAGAVTVGEALAVLVERLEAGVGRGQHDVRGVLVRASPG